MSTDIGYMLSICAGIFIGIQIFNWLCDKRREAQQEENELVNQQLKRQMERICWEQRYKSELEKLKTEQRQQIPELWGSTYKFTATCEPKDGMLLEYHGKLLTYKSGIGWTILETESEKFSKKEIIKDLWYGTGGK